MGEGGHVILADNWCTMHCADEQNYYPELKTTVPQAVADIMFREKFVVKPE